MLIIMLMLMIIEVDNNDNDGSYDSIKMVAGREDMGDMNKYIIESQPSDGAD